MVLKSKSNIYNNNLLKSFDENGYVILDVIDKKKLNEVKKDLHVMILDSLKSNASEFVSKNKKKLKNKNFILNDGLIYLEKKNHKFSRVHLEDVSGFLFRSLENLKPGEIYNIADDKPISNEEVLGEILNKYMFSQKN